MTDQESPTASGVELHASGTTFEELLANAAEATFSQIVDLETIKERGEYSFSIPWEGTNQDIFVDFLREIIRIIQKEEFLARSCEVDIDSDELSVTFRGQHINHNKHTIMTDVKGLSEEEEIILEEDINGTFQVDFALDV